MTVVFHFVHACSVGVAVRAHRAESFVNRFVLRIQHHGEYFFLIEAEVTAKEITFVLEQFRTLDVGRVILSVVIVVLQQAQSLPQRRSGNEDHPQPMVDDAIGNFQRVSGDFHRHAADYRFTAVQLLVKRLAVFGRLSFHPQEWSVRALSREAQIIRNNVAIKGGDGFRTQFGGSNGRGKDCASRSEPQQRGNMTHRTQ